MVQVPHNGMFLCMFSDVLLVAFDENIYTTKLANVKVSLFLFPGESDINDLPSQTEKGFLSCVLYVLLEMLGLVTK